MKCQPPLLTVFFVGASSTIIEEERVRHGYQPIVLVKTAPSSAGVTVVKQAAADEQVGMVDLAEGGELL